MAEVIVELAAAERHKQEEQQDEQLALQLFDCPFAVADDKRIVMQDKAKDLDDDS